MYNFGLPKSVWGASEIDLREPPSILQCLSNPKISVNHLFFNCSIYDEPRNHFHIRNPESLTSADETNNVLEFLVVTNLPPAI